MKKHTQIAHFTIGKHEENKGLADELSAIRLDLSEAALRLVEVGLDSVEVGAFLLYSVKSASLRR